MVVKVGHRRERCSYQVRRVGFVVAAFSTDPIKELSAEGKVCDEVYWQSDESISSGDSA